MGLPAPFCELLLRENLRDPFTGTILILGKQSILLSPKSFSQLLEKYNIGFTGEMTIDKSTLTANQIDEPLIADTVFFNSLNVNPDDISVMDVSDYEGADIVHDLNYPVPEQYHSQFDLIIDGSVFDNIFDPVTALQNIASMLKPNGRVIMLEMASNFAFPFLVFSPEWFYDFYIHNNFVNCEVFSGVFTEKPGLLFGPWNLSKFIPVKSGREMIYLPNLDHQEAVQIICSRKGPSATTYKIPCQSVYRDDAEAEIFKINGQQTENFFNIIIDQPQTSTWNFQEILGPYSTIKENTELGIQIIEATYGWNCRYQSKLPITQGNVTKFFQEKCQGQKKINLKIDVRELGDPAPGLPKDLSIIWIYAEDPERNPNHLYLNPEADGKTISLS